MDADLPAGAELDALVAKAAGIEVTLASDGTRKFMVRTMTLGTGARITGCGFAPSSNIADAFAALEAMRGKGWAWRLWSYGRFDLWHADRGEIEVCADTPALAISRAIAAAGRA